ncbi:GHKL domain-containing protein [Enterococcus sp. DIV0756]|uniref:GHKL domain-containing protein n=1 Tax=Enterococcus sp. DIV0756 TaxID=2774636 RepID=UPI003F6893DD
MFHFKERKTIAEGATREAVTQQFLKGEDHVFWMLLGINFANISTAFVLLAWANSLIFNKGLDTKKLIILTFAIWGSAAFLGTCITYQQIVTAGHYEKWLLYVQNVYNIVFYLIYTHLLLKKVFIYQRMFVYVFTTLLMAAINYMISGLLYSSGLDQLLLNQSVLVSSLAIDGSTLIFTILLIKFFDKFGLFQQFDELLKHRRAIWLMIIGFFIYDAVFILREAYADKTVFYYGLFYLALFFIASYFAIKLSRRQRTRLAQELLTQQEIYSRHLELAQKELHTVQHNYQAILSSLTNYAEVDDSIGMLNFLQKEVFQIDQSVDEHIKQMNQLVLIEVVELKGLVLSKILEAEKRGCRLLVEVQTPITQISMTITDLLRCVGILLDNAIEATADDSELTLILLQEKHLTIVVKNSFDGTPDLQKIWHESYSTKGSERGFGLSNLRQIVSGYDNILQDTRIEQDQFVQVLIIEKEAAYEFA